MEADFPRVLADKWRELDSLRRFLTRHRINVVLDVGANEGQFATKLRRLGYRGHIASFEPDPRAYSRLVERHGRDPSWRGYPIALGEADTAGTFHLGANSDLSSFLRSVHETNIASTLELPIRRIDGLMSEILGGIAEPRVLLKTDTQGFDLDVLRGAAGSLHQVIGLLAELSVVPIYDGSPPLSEALRAYKDAGFDLVELNLVTRTVDGRILELDGLFVRRDSVP